ncbi:MAG: Uma2 family endonuclease [Isosphaeraceae bacterium]
MTTVPPQAPPTSVSPHLAARLSRLTVDQYDRMTETGMLHRAEDVELIEGLLVFKIGRNREHVQAGKLGLAALQRIIPPGWHVAKEDPFVASNWSKPEPDLAVVRGRIEDYAKRNVTSGDLGLIVEIAESSLAEDRDVMGRLYAAGGISVYWIVNLVDRCVEVHSDPDPGTGYRTRAVLQPGQQIPVVLDGAAVGAVPVDDLLP